MASLRTSQAARLLRTVSSRTPQVAARRFESSSTSSIVKAKAPVNEPAPPEPSVGNAHNQPDYGCHIDIATSYVRKDPAHRPRSRPAGFLS